MIDPASLSTLGFILVLAGFIVIFLAIILMFFSSADGERKVRGGGAIIIGPVPIVFGTDKESVKVLLVLSIILMVFVLLVYVIFNYS
jgi:uncharacterized protein (TIGR00304 family)